MIKHSKKNNKFTKAEANGTVLWSRDQKIQTQAESDWGETNYTATTWQ